MVLFIKSSTIVVLLCLVWSVYCSNYHYCGWQQNILECAEMLGGSLFVDLVLVANVAEYFLAPFRTLFLPTDDAILVASREVKNLTRSGRLPDALLHHLVDNITDLSAEKNDDILVSSNAWQLRINMYKNQKITNFECANNTTISGSRVIFQPRMRRGTPYRVIVINRFISQFPVDRIYDSIIKEDKYSIFALAASKANLLDIFKNESLTLFLPNNVAFSKLPPGTLSSLLSDPTKLKEVLLGHVIRTTYYSQGLRCLSGVTTLSNTTISMRVHNHHYNVMSGTNNISTVTVDISNRNGVIHEISEVILPNSF